MELINLKDLTEICRLCAHKGTTLHFIFKSETIPRNNDIFLSIKELIDSEISEFDDLPRNVCDSCSLILYQFEEFRNRCRESIANLKSLVTMKYVELFKEPEVVIETPPDEQLNIKEKPTLLRRRIGRSCKGISNPPILDEETEESLSMPISAKQKKSVKVVKPKRKKYLTVKSNTANIEEKSLEDPDYDPESGKTVKKQKGGKQMCPICGVLVCSLQNHMQVHALVKEFPCDICGKTFNLRGNVAKHKNIVHNPARLFPCDHCNMRFKTSSMVFRHMMAIHNGERKYKCTLCDKSFYSSNIFKNHCLTHTQERNFECKFCHSKFLTSQRLLHHMPKHTGEKPYQCGVCTMRFCYSSRATQHRRIHMKNNAYVCSFCSLEFRDMRMFRIHHSDVHKVQLPLTSSNDDGPEESIGDVKFNPIND